MIPLTNKERKLHCKQKVCHTCKKRFSTDDYKFQKVRRLEIIVITQENIGELPVIFSI